MTNLTIKDRFDLGMMGINRYKEWIEEELTKISGVEVKLIEPTIYDLEDLK